MTKIENARYEDERSLYGLSDASLNNVIFEGEKDGESPLKESSNLTIENTIFSLRYALWHNKNTICNNSKFMESCRAALWYSNNVEINDSTVEGVKFLRECKNITINNSNINSIEFSWMSSNINIENSAITSVYPFFNVSNLKLSNVSLNGKYSFQYSKNIYIENSNFDTKDAFWHTSSAIIKNTTIKGEYIGWYSKNLTFINCNIIGTQPFCYSKNIKLINCKMELCDFAFENTTVKGEINSNIISIKNPIKCNLVVDKVDEIIIDEYKKKGKVKIIDKSMI